MLSRLRRLFGCSAYKQAEPPAAKESQKVFHAAHGVLKDKLDALLANDQSGLCQEYNSLTDCNILETSDTAEHAQNASKNRYVNVLPFDFNRVKISGEDDYINASLIQVRGAEMAKRGPAGRVLL